MQRQSKKGAKAGYEGSKGLAQRVQTGPEMLDMKGEKAWHKGCKGKARKTGHEGHKGWA